MADNLTIEIDVKNLEIVKQEIKKLKSEIKKLKKNYIKCKTCAHKELITIECKIDDCKYKAK